MSVHGKVVHRRLAARPATIEDVARAAGVSRQTVSRVLNDQGDVAAATRERIQRVMRDLDYRPNLFARGLITRTSHTFGLVVPDITSPFFAEIARAAKETALAGGYQMLLAHTAEDPAQEVQSLRQLRQLHVDGVIVVNSRLPDDSLRQALAGLGPVVLTNRVLDDGFGRVEWPGYEAGGSLATEHLLAQGHRAIGYVDADPTTTAGQARLAGHRAALAAAGLPDDGLIATGPPSGAGGYAAARRLLERRPPLTALFAYNDTMAIGAMRACADAGRRVPEDVAVVGFGGAPLAQWTIPRLTTVPVPLQAIGQAAAEMLLGLLGGAPPGVRVVDLPPTLVVRESSAGAGAR